MKNVLAVIVNYGSDQLSYLQQVVSTLTSFKNYNTTVVVNSNIPLDEIAGIDQVNVIAQYSKFFDLSDLWFKIDMRNHWKGRVYNYNFLPMTCRQVIDNESNNYDYFIYTENDHLWLEHHVDKFAEYENILPQSRIAGLIQYEANTEGRYFPGYHGRYEWDFNSVEEYGGKRFAHFANVHQACFIISKQQLRRIKEQRDFTQFFSNDRYSIKCKTNTDIYQYCGMKKVICVSEFELNLIHHLPNIYINGQLGRTQLRSDENRMRLALERLLQ